MSQRSSESHPRVFFDLPDDVTAPAAVILPVAYDATSSWIKGAAGGPAAVLDASQYVEVWDIETASEPWRHGIATLPTIKFQGDPVELAKRVRRRVNAILESSRLPLVQNNDSAPEKTQGKGKKFQPTPSCLKKTEATRTKSRSQSASHLRKKQTVPFVPLLCSSWRAERSRQ